MTHAEPRVRLQPPAPPCFRGEDSPLVRPYVLSATEWNCLKRHRQQQRRRRHPLWLAVYGIDLGPRLIHGAKIKGEEINGVRVAA
ncbi:hypothetical protein AQI88_30225 [Streptomyces cellostaticus]|uniref:Uncharacterized protein n=1 Tax=Streptomyces cellostaticus TaxID=67285 RepID=A0A101NH30_9ACTN|nr:hypothetical protein AQI88_30225 [Streptomyces cellostaticus]